MRYPAKGPTWGVLVQAPSDAVKHLLQPLAARFDSRQIVYRANGMWIAVFNMEPGDPSDNAAAEILEQQPYSPLYKFDFNPHEYLTFRWEGSSWERDADPAHVLAAHGIDIPGWDEPAEAAVAPTPSPRRASVVENATVDQARQLVENSELTIEQGPRGAIVHNADAEARVRLWQRAPHRVYELLFYPRSRNFHFRVMKGEECLGTYRPGETRTWDGTPFLADVDGETSPERIIDLFGIERAFLAPIGNSGQQ